jgi:hypothetical protein
MLVRTLLTLYLPARLDGAMETVGGERHLRRFKANAQESFGGWWDVGRNCPFTDWNMRREGGEFR